MFAESLLWNGIKKVYSTQVNHFESDFILGKRMLI